MDGLIMLRDYLDKILDGKKRHDARAYGTNKRGTIALVDTKKSAVIGLIDLVVHIKSQLKNIASGNGKA